MSNKKFDSVQMHRDICDEMHDLYERKNKNYGDSFHLTFLEEGYAMARIRLSDKLSRFKSMSHMMDDDDEPLVAPPERIDYESIRDTLIDLANYAVMTVIEMDRVEKEMEEVADQISEAVDKIVPGVEAIQAKNTKLENEACSCKQCAYYHLKWSENPCFGCSDNYSKFTPLEDRWLPKDKTLKCNGEPRQCSNCWFQNVLTNQYPCNACSHTRICDTCKHKYKQPCPACVDHNLWEADI